MMDTGKIKHISCFIGDRGDAINLPGSKGSKGIPGIAGPPGIYAYVMCT